jgi:hypothetical protein
MEEKMIFKPRSSIGWVSLSLLAVIVLAIAASMLITNVTRFAGAILLVLGLYFSILAIWWPTMRYELDREALTLIYGTAINYRIPLDSIRSMRRVDLTLSLWSSMRMPGVALFTVPYGDIGQVKMCATASLNGILLIETDKGLYGLTPAEEDRLAAEVQTRMVRR